MFLYEKILICLKSSSIMNLEIIVCYTATGDTSKTITVELNQTKKQTKI